MEQEGDLIALTFPEELVDVTKRGTLQFLAAVYDPLGVASPTIIVGKLLYFKVFELSSMGREGIEQNGTGVVKLCEEPFQQD